MNEEINNGDSDALSQESEANNEQLERERTDLLTRVASAKLSTIGHRIAWVLNHFPKTRSSDIALQIKYWQLFDKVKNDCIAIEDLYALTRLTSLARARAKIQNEYQLFLADAEVQEHRGTLEEAEKDKALESTDYPVYAVFLDESGKTSKKLIVGSLWFLAEGSQSIALYLSTQELKKRSKFVGEFHFSEMGKEDVEVYKELIEIFISQGGAISFKFISVEREGIKHIQTAIEDLYYMLLVGGIDHEISTGRAPLPRILNVWKDMEEPGGDKILMAKLTDKLHQASAHKYGGKLIVEKCVAVDSQSNIFLQVADLVASSVNRILSRSGSAYNHKDEFANYLISRLGIKTAPDLDIPIGDVSAHIRL
jgi:hypothetical protein